MNNYGGMIELCCFRDGRGRGRGGGPEIRARGPETGAGGPETEPEAETGANPDLVLGPADAER